MEGDGAEPRAPWLYHLEYVNQSVVIYIYIYVCSIVLLLNVGQSFQKDLSAAWTQTDLIRVISGSSRTADNFFLEMVQQS